MPKSCNNCGTDKKPSSVPYAVLVDFKETAKANSLKWFIICLVLIVLLVGSNIGWLVYESQFDVIEETYTEDYDIEANDNGNAIYNDDGSVVIGEDKSNENQNS
jgi:hypothetical protein